MRAWILSSEALLLAWLLWAHRARSRGRKFPTLDQIEGGLWES